MRNNNDYPRLIEHAFPLKQASLDSVHEKNVRHGHISTLHIWPARRPLAACRAALIATLLPDPGTPEERRRILEKLAGRVVRKVEKKKLPGGRVIERIREETKGGILHWGRENGPALEWFREEIKKAYGGRAPRVLDPFAGGGSILLEAMRLGCEVTAIDINPVAWFILKCTLEYPQKLAGQKRPLPEFILADEDFMEAFYKVHPGIVGRGRPQKGQLDLEQLDLESLLSQPETGELPVPEADLSWHVRAWGRWVLTRARQELARYYPAYADFEPLKPDGLPFELREPRLVPLKEDGSLDLEALNAEFTEEYLRDPRNPRWVAKPTVAYLWARTVQCKNCRATVPLLKTRWLCKKDKKRVVLTMEPNPDKTGVVFGIQNDVPVAGGNAAQRREHDRKVGAGTMSRSGATCPCCGTIMTMEDIRLEGRAGRLGAVMTAVVVDGPNGKEYRLPTAEEVRLAQEAEKELDRVFAEIPFGLPEEPTPKGGSGASRAFSVDGYGFDKWFKLFTPRQLLALGTFVKHTRAARDAMREAGYPPEWVEAVGAYLAQALDFVANRNSVVCSWTLTRETTRGTFARFALPIVWDFAEANPSEEASGGYPGAIEWVCRYIDHVLVFGQESQFTRAFQKTATEELGSFLDVIVTDPPYYDAIPYSDLMDFFYVWLRRTLYGLSPEIDEVFREPLSPKWDHEKNDGELIDDASRFGGDRQKSKAAYEEGMFRAFQACYRALKPEGRMVIVFAHKHPDAWETLVSAIIRAGFVVVASWPIQTEMGNRTRALSSAALASSVWLVCKKRPETARPGWDNRVLEEMRDKIYARLREFWDAGIRGPDFVWAATGPALEAYSKHPVVKKANEPGQVMTVSEFLRAVRRLVVDFVVGRVLSHNGGAEGASGLDDVTTYYLLHRHDFGFEDVPAGACILYAVSCGLSDRELVDQYDLLVRTGGQEQDEEEEEAGIEAGDEIKEGTGSKVRLKPWQQRRRKTLGLDAEGRPAPLIDQVHRLMHLWKAGDVVKVDEYLDARGLRRHRLFHQLLQALIELAPPGSDERSLLESISNHLAARGTAPGEQLELFV
ncbi:MAG: putative methylase [Clostridia bacterium]|nr:putative methylase [Clostridia bacterium]